MNKRPLNRKDLDDALKTGCGCREHDCEGPFYLHSVCHNDAPTWVRYDGDGVISVECAVCKSIVTKIQVADPKLRILSNNETSA